MAQVSAIIARATKIAAWAFPAVLWLAFVTILLLAGHVMLAACDFGFAPLYGYRYCTAPAEPHGLLAERNRDRDLRAGIDNVELQIASLPSCPQPPNPPPPPRDKAEIPLPEPSKQPQVKEQLKIPTRLEDLKGCWQSVRGDIWNSYGRQGCSSHRKREDMLLL
jgi:hypothetical protein